MNELERPQDATPPPSEAAAGPRRDTSEFARSIPAQLIVLTGVHAGKRIPLRGEAVVGRSGSASICLPDPHISRQHARIWQEPGGGFFLQDLGSHNGTAINGTCVEQRQERLAFGDKIQLGQGSVLLFTRYEDLEEQLLQSQKLEALGQLAGGIAHDFNDLLSAIMGNLGVLRTVIDHGDLVACLDDIELAADRAATLTRQLLNFSLRSRSSQRLVNFSRLVDEAVGLAKRTFDRGVQLATDVAPSLHVLGDSSALHQALMNLLINARDALPAGGEIRVSAQAVTPEPSSSAEDGPQVLVTIADTGVGMDEETQRRAFEPYFTTKRRGGGTGLGLSTVYGIVQSHGGRVSVQSAAGQGTTFRIFLPQAEASAQPERFATAALSRRQKGTVLVVEREQLVAAALVRLLHSLGYGTVSVTSPADALASFRQQRDTIQLIIADLTGAELEGVDDDEGLLRALQQVNPNVPVVLMAACDEGDRLRSLKRLGVTAQLAKPFTREAVKVVLNQALGIDLGEIADTTS